MKLDEKLISLRKEKGLTQAKVAEKLDVSRQAISRWESGAAMPSTESLRSLSELYGVSVDVLLNDQLDTPSEDEVHHQIVAVADKTIQGNKSKRSRIVAVVLLLVAILAVVGTVIRFNAESKKAGEESLLPIDEMETDQEDDYPSESFSVGW